MSIFDGISGEIDGLGVAFETGTGRTTREVSVYLTPEEVHEALLAASRIVVRGGSEPRVENAKTVHRQTDQQGTWGTATVDVRIFENMRQLVGELCDLAANEPDEERYYQFGEWFLELQTGDGYYIETYGNTAQVRFGNWSTTHGRFELGSNYSAMMSNGSFQVGLATEFARDWLRGKPLVGVNAGTANTVVAMLVSEALRNHRTYLINLMCLDLIDWGITTWAEMPDKYHPMARGGTYERGTTGFAGGEKDPTTRLYEKVLTLNWLSNVQDSGEVYLYRYNNDGGDHDATDVDLKQAAKAKVRSRLASRGYKTIKMPKSG